MAYFDKGRTAIQRPQIPFRVKVPLANDVQLLEFLRLYFYANLVGSLASRVALRGPHFAGRVKWIFKRPADEPQVPPLGLRFTFNG